MEDKRCSNCNLFKQYDENDIHRYSDNCVTFLCGNSKCPYQEIFIDEFKKYYFLKCEYWYLHDNRYPYCKKREEEIGERFQECKFDLSCLVSKL